MTYKIEGTVKFFDLSDLQIISSSYFKNFLKADYDNKAFYDTGFIHTRFKRLHTQIEERMLLRGIIALITGAYPEFAFESFYIIDKNDKVIIDGFPQRLCIPPRSGLDLMIHHEIDPTRIYVKAFENLNLELVLILFSQRMDDLPFIGWSNLYSIYEIIGKDIHIKTNKCKLII